MKDIAILTFHRAINCGAVLQAYALQEVLLSKYNAYILDYRCDYIEDVYYNKENAGSSFRKLVKKILFFRMNRKKQFRRDKFIEFQGNYLNLSRTFISSTVVDANELFDYFVVGSDQVWNLLLSHGDWNYFLDFADNEKKYSYAASFGGAIDDSEQCAFAQKLSGFRSILVREKEGIQIVNQLVEDKKVSVVCDPVFMMSRLDWIERFSLETKPKEKYIIVYLIAKTQYAIDFARNLGKMLGTKVYFINNSGTRKIDRGFVDIRDAGPIDFLSLILNAEAVVTSSFHAMAFSLIFNKPFYYELNCQKKNSNSRIEDIAELFDVQDHQIFSSTPKQHMSINWDKINKIIEDYSNRSKTILLDSLDDGKDENE